MSKPPAEKSIEVVFAMYASQLAQKLGKKLIIYAPSQTQEKDLGYDAKLIGKGCRELYIQFKSVDARNYGLVFKPKKQKQLETLQKKFPPMSAFYVASTFRDEHSLFQKQHLLTTQQFLDCYFAVDARVIPVAKSNIRFNQNILDVKSNISSYPNEGQGHNKLPIRRQRWRTGYELLCDFFICSATTHGSKASPTVGSRIQVRNKVVIRRPFSDDMSNYPDPIDERNYQVVPDEPIYISRDESLVGGISLPSSESSIVLRVFDEPDQ